MVFLQCEHQCCHATLFLHGTNGMQMQVVMVMWVASNANLVTSQWACMSHMCVHGTCAIITMGMLNYLNSLMGMPADSNLKKLTTSHFNVQITQNANENMPNMFPILYLNENLRYCDENLAWGK